nr:putative reverse transcriptase domain-containing protein [Tanacetum cinerariifolium]
MHVRVSSGSESPSHTETGMRFMLAPRSANARHSSIPENSQGVVDGVGAGGKLNPRYVGPFKMLEEIEKVAYKLDLPEELSRVHNTFHVSNLKKCHADEPLAVPLDGLHFDDKLHFVEEPVEIMDREVKRLKKSRILLVK